MFNNLLYAYQPVQTQFADTQVYLQELKSTARTLDDEIRQFPVEQLQQTEHTVLYYDYLSNAIQQFSSIQKSLAEIEFLTEQLNFR